MTTGTRSPTQATYDASVSAPATFARLQSIDLVRGIVMLLMAIDHVRVYSGVPAGGDTAGVFFTRWITHFAAPAFTFLAGTSAYLLGQKLGNTRALTRHLLIRGLLLVLLELTVIRVSWTFNLDFASYNLAGVIWMLGWCMVILAALIHLPMRVIGIVGILLIVLQNVFAPISSALPSAIGSAVYLGGDFRLGPRGPPIFVLYVLVPWVGVMAAGYAFGAIMNRSPEDRRRFCLRVGLGLTGLFVVVASALAVAMGDRSGDPFLFRVLQQQKYPASIFFLMMTLGPTIAFMPVAERARGMIAHAVTTIGRVPLFFYLLHIPFIHALAMIVSFVREGQVNPWLYGNHPFSPPDTPPGYQWSLALLYAILIVAVVGLYWPSRWYADVKARTRHGWLTYL